MLPRRMGCHSQLHLIMLVHGATQKKMNYIVGTLTLTFYLPWALKKDDYYEHLCTEREVMVHVGTEKVRHHILQHLEYQAQKGKSVGTVLVIQRGKQSMVADYKLKHGDILLPSNELLDIGRFEHVAVPFWATFWRPRRDAKGRRDEICRHRNPLCTPELGTRPSDLFQCDLLHTWQLGPLQRWVTGSLWRIALHNPFHIQGHEKDRMVVIGKRMRQSLLEWYKKNRIPYSNRLYDLNMACLLYTSDAADE